MNLLASFDLPAHRVAWIVSKIEERTGSRAKVEILIAGPDLCHVVGRPRDVMLVIGEVAHYGDDSLNFVSQES